MHYKKGDKVKHPKQENWGLGVVLENQQDEKVRVFFENSGEKILSTKIFQPQIIIGNAAQHPILDKLQDNSKFLGLTILLNNFLSKFPNGFQDINYLEKEVYHKQGISDFAHKVLSEKIFLQLLVKDEYATITQLIKSIIHKDTLSLIDRFEKIVLLETLDHTDFQKEFVCSLYALLYGNTSDFDQNFIEFARVLSEMRVSKWTIMTYFLFIFHPNKYIFLKPSVTQNLAKICEFNLYYETTLNIITYHRVLKFAHYLFENLKALGLAPENMVDIQSFIWIAGRD
ncbi:DUF3553 domain-containing protein [Wohlfahrtiimonas larvae]|uniref:DUF3553 domain-containing protein n=1 Tax=Wohlfahrtiimonas larvae TaxID=1157986 RepID=A0ABP9MIS6_9GAMM|nr:DUF3553 domain-containing protein [Wohlfahrtiimonas larvae]